MYLLIYSYYVGRYLLCAKSNPSTIDTRKFFTSSYLHINLCIDMKANNVRRPSINLGIQGEYNIYTESDELFFVIHSGIVNKNF